MYAFVLLHVFSIQWGCLHCMKLLMHERLSSVIMWDFFPAVWSSAEMHSTKWWSWENRLAWRLWVTFEFCHLRWFTRVINCTSHIHTHNFLSFATQTRDHKLEDCKKIVDEASQNVVPLTQENLLEASAMTCPTTYLSLATFYTAFHNPPFHKEGR